MTTRRNTKVTGPHALWFLFCQSLFQADRDLAELLWDHIPNRGAVLWQLQIMESRGADSRIAHDRARRLGAILTPRALLAAALAVAPEGQPRSEAVRNFEDNVLRITNPDGTWIW
jgi:hypothetical protein